MYLYRVYFFQLLVSHAITTKLINNHGTYIIGEHMDDIKVEAAYGSFKIPPNDIKCVGAVKFQNSYLQVSHHTEEGTMVINCTATYKKFRSIPYTYRINFLGMTSDAFLWHLFIFQFRNLWKVLSYI